jgi:hypothetical protein
MDLAKKFAFYSAIERAAKHGHTDDLVALLRSDHPIKPADRAMLADYLDGKLKPPRHRPKRRGLDVRHQSEANAEAIERAADYVRFVKGQLRETGEWYGRHEEVMDHVVAVAERMGWPVPDPYAFRQAVENRWRRSTKSRKH